MDTFWEFLFEVALPCEITISLLGMMAILIFDYESLILGDLNMSPETIAALRIELRAKQAELDALKEESWSLKS